MTTTATLTLKDVARWVDDALAAIGDWVSSITTPGYVLIAVAALALLWLISAIRAQTRLGPIEIADLQHDEAAAGNAKSEVAALTAEFRERLWKLGLTPPPLVPEGTPQADLITAVSEVAPQGKAIASLLKLLPSPPRPPSFKVTTTLVGGVPTPAAASARRPPPFAPRPAGTCGVRFMLQSKSGGPPYLHAVAGCADHRLALQRAAAQIFQQITRSATVVFPVWARWRSVTALGLYVDGCAAGTAGDLETAVARLEDAVEATPFNALVALQLGNALEQTAAAYDAKWPVAYFQALALQRYLITGELWPTLVEARYRTGVVCAALAISYAELPDPDQQEAIRDLVPIPRLDEDDADASVTSTTGFAERLRRLAGREVTATLQLLRPYYTLVHERRFRNQFEPKGVARRQLNHTARISRHCVRMRALNVRPQNLRWRWEAAAHDRMVHAYHLGLGRANITWQARYNAASFDAVRLRGDQIPEKRRRDVEKRALRNLDDAIREAGGALKYAWIRNDPDFEAFHLPRQEPDGG